MKRSEAARTIATEGRRHTLVAYFTERTDGQERRMVCRYDGDPIRGGLVKVWDLEKGAWRQVNLDAVRLIRVCGVDRKAEPAAPALKGEAKLEQLRREMAEIF